MRSGVLLNGLLAALALVLAFTWVQLARSGSQEKARPRVPVHEEQSSVPGSKGEGRIAGARLAARIARWHAESARQELDARALGAHLGFSSGEPFQCLLELGAEPTPADAPVALDLGLLRVEDEQGTALASCTPPAKGASGPVDPLTTLVAPPREPLRPGERVSILLWGRAPLGDSRLVFADGTSIALSDAPVETRDLVSLARVEEPRGRTGEGAQTK